jgi:L-rhamnose mutarotase
MERFAFKMFLNRGCESEYRARHDAIWPELAMLLRGAGISNYSIHLDAETNVLFAYLERRHDHSMEALAADRIMQRWWDAMKDVMRTNADGSPVVVPLVEMFHLA